MRLSLKKNFPEMRYILAIFNRMTIEGNVIRVKVEHALDTPYLRIELQRCRKYSFVIVQRNLENVDSETKAKISNISENDILLFDTDEAGSYVDISTYSSFSSLPSFNLPGIPDTMIPSLDKIDTDSLLLESIFTLRKSFYELGDFAKIFNMLLERHAFARMTLKDRKHFELCFFVDEDCRSSFYIGFGLWIPKKNSKQFSSWNPNFYEDEVHRFNRLLTGCDDHFTGKFYLKEGNRPTLTFRAVSKKHKP